MSRLSAAGASRLPRATVGRIPLLPIASCAAVAATAFAGGGYFPRSWGWTTLAAGWAAAALLVGGRRVELSRTALASIALMAGLAAWTAISAIWSIDVTQTALEAQRTSIYVAVMLAALIWAGRDPERILHGVWAAIVVVSSWSLLTRLVPDRFGVVDAISGYRLSEPLGYWNALGLFAAMGALLAFGIVARATSRFARAAAAGSMPIVALTVYFTFSRGAWIGLAAGLAAAIIVARRRLQLVVALAGVAPWTALAVWRAAVSPALTTSGSALSDMAHEGHRLALVLVGVSAGSALTTLLLATAEARIRVGIWPRRLAGFVVLSAAAVGLVGAFAHFGSPSALATRAWSEFSSGSNAGTSGSLNTRLFHLNGNDRADLWRVAWRDAREHPVLGSGAGSYEDVWAKDRPVALKVRDAHNLYVETLAELGPFGLALLAGLLGLPLVAALRARRRPLAFAAFGAYTAFLAHAVVDWDWEMPAVTLAALLCGVSLVAAEGRRLGPGTRRVALCGAVTLAALGIYTIASQLPIGRIHAAARREDWSAAVADARRAADLAPWSAQPWLTLGEAELRAGRLAQARTHLGKATARSPRSWIPWLDLARASTGAERAAALARASALNPLSPEIAAVRAQGPR